MSPPRRGRTRAGRRRTALWLGLFLVIALAAAIAGGREVLDGGDAAPPPAASAPEPPLVPLTIPEGMRREDVAALVAQKTRISREAYLRATGPGARGAQLSGRDAPTSLEGFLFPATYEIGTETTARRLVDAQVEAYRERVAGLDYRPAARRNLTSFDVLIIASMIEREVSVPDERARVAAVIYNRLRAGMPLGIDATVQYAIGRWAPTLTASDLRTDSPYNTRRYGGLPPGPIASPGEASLLAATRPADTRALYYVARDDGSGRHWFARTAAGHDRNVARAGASGGG